MNRYEPLIPRVAFGIAAVAMTAITIGVSVIMPAKMDSDSPEPRMLEALTVTAPASKGDVTGRAHRLREHRRRRCTQGRVVRGPVHLATAESQTRAVMKPNPGLLLAVA